LKKSATHDQTLLETSAKVDENKKQAVGGGQRFPRLGKRGGALKATGIASSCTPDFFFLSFFLTFLFSIFLF
jgi:hypothetical protein